ncbi:MAG: GNAT family N-acetyltransferase [Spirochaetota bacterium]|jgi:GNAT superfamily N-acetyltransferase|nr:GNAT family N-acetyltransferase [Spirochaetota bacterium]NMA56569.1 GNAT family N-acetyltransferase [Treponema sp.]
MEFDLTDELIKQITFAMENQKEHFLLDSCEKVLIKKTDIAQRLAAEENGEDISFSETQNQNRFYTLPEWNSILGFKMMEKFVSVLKNPLARSDLKQVLSLGKGVFRNFKNKLSEYPEVEKLWLNFKDAEMKKMVLDWYNRHRASWGLDLLPIEFNETDALILEDFLFRFSSLAEEPELFERYQGLFFDELCERAEEEDDEEVLAFLWKEYHFLQEEREDLQLCIVETIEEDFAGIAAFFQLAGKRKKRFLIPFLYVEKNFRGLGLGNELLQRIRNYATEQGVRQLVVHNSFVPDVLVSVLLKNGFQKTKGIYFANVAD